MQQQDLLPHLFRSEFSKITTVLTRHFGLDQVEVAEDIASEVFLTALETWTYKGIPENPVAWLYAVASNKAKNYLQRQKTFSQKVTGQVKQTMAENSPTEIDLSEVNITDSQLRMLFAICHPSISTEAQVGLALRLLCGFGIDEIANALLTNKETISKRLFRAKEKLRAENIPVELPPVQDIPQRLESVLTTLYLLFNEGYYSESHDWVLREDLCLEAMRLTYMLIENKTTHQPKVNALLSLMCFHASRFAARKNEQGDLVLYDDQNEALWNHDLIARGAFYLQQAAQGKTISKYHLEAGIAYWHTVKEDTMEKWENILQLYNKLLQLEYSPIAALNRTYALAKVKGTGIAIKEAEKLQLINNHYYYTLLGELYKTVDNVKAKQHFLSALSLAKNQADKETISRKFSQL